MSDDFKLYIWHDIRRDYTGGVGFAVGRSKTEAIEAIEKTCKTDPERKWEWDSYAGELLTTEPEVRDLPAGDWIGGGG